MMQWMEQEINYPVLKFCLFFVVLDFEILILITTRFSTLQLQIIIIRSRIFYFMKIRTNNPCMIIHTSYCVSSLGLTFQIWNRVFYLEKVIRVRKIRLTHEE